MNKITCCHTTLVATEKRIGLESKQTKDCFFPHREDVLF